MSFHDLPQDWTGRSLRDLRLAADVVDLFVRESERASGCISLLLTDADGRMIQPITVGEVPLGAPAEQRTAFFETFLGHLGGSLGGLVLALGRPSGLVPTDDERAWHESAIETAAREGVELVATYLATGDGVVLMPTLTERDLAG